jgi:hypothetical protein
LTAGSVLPAINCWPHSYPFPTSLAPLPVGQEWRDHEEGCRAATRSRAFIATAAAGRSRAPQRRVEDRGSARLAGHLRCRVPGSHPVAGGCLRHLGQELDPSGQRHRSDCIDRRTGANLCIVVRLGPSPAVPDSAGAETASADPVAAPRHRSRSGRHGRRSWGDHLPLPATKAPRLVGKSRSTVPPRRDLLCPSG